MRSSSKAKRTTHLFGARLSLTIIFLVSLGIPAFGQTTAARPDRGASTGGAYAVSDIESTNLQNGNVSLSIPLASLPPIAGGKLSWTISARYNSKLWNVTREEQVTQELPYQTIFKDMPQQSDRGGWSVGGKYEIIFRDARDDFDYQVPPYDVNIHNEWHRLADHSWKKVILVTPDGAEYELRPSDAAVAYYGIDAPRDYLRMFYRETPDTRSAPMRYHSLDGTYLSVLINPNASSDPIRWTIFTPDGTQVIQYKSGVQRIKDANNNFIKIFTNVENGVPTTHYQDEQTLREIKVTTDYSTGNLRYQVWYKTVGGEWAHTDVNFGTTEVKGKVYSVESWNQSTGMPCRSDLVLQDTLTVVRSIVFPQTEPGVAGRQFTFSYNSDTTQSATQSNMRWVCGQPTESYTRTASYGSGSLSKIVMPTGAVVDYTYSKDGVHEFVGPFPSLPSEDDITREVLVTKKVTHDSTMEQWTYNIPTSGVATTSSVTNPNGSVITENYYPTDTRFNMVMSAGGTAGLGGFVYRTQQPGQITEKRWAMLSPGGQGVPGTGAAPDVLVTMNPVVAAEYTTILDASGAPYKMSAKKYQYDLNGNVKEVREYDWFDPNQVTRDGAGVPTAVPATATLLRVSNTSYHNSVDDASSNLYLSRMLIQGTPLFLNAPKETSAGGSVTRFSYDSQAHGSAPTAGNVTSVSSLDNKGDADATNDGWITAGRAYGAYGNVSAATDGRGKTTSFFYDDATHALPTRVVVDPENGTGTQTVTTVYDYATGLVTGVTDQNNQTSTIDYTNQLLGTVDPFGRPGVQLSPTVTVNGTQKRRHVKSFYYDSARKLTITSDLNAESDGLLKSETFSDQLGRTTESRQYETSTTYVTVKQKYDSMGRVIESSNPYRSGDTVLWTTTAYDQIGRVKTVTTPDGAAVKSNYNGNFVMVTDQAGRSRRSETDALGRLRQVVEYNRTFSNPTSVQAPDANDYLTSYTYDTLGNLRRVEQGSQQRYFMYDSLSRLIRAKNPEQADNASLNVTDPVTGHNGWSLGYSYDANGNLTQRTDARGVVSTYGYDSLNRNITVRYTDAVLGAGNHTKDIDRHYDGAINGKGRFWFFNWDVDNTRFDSHLAIDEYDAAGRPKQQRQRFLTGGVSSLDYTTTLTYDLAGNVKTQTYPSGHAVSYSYDTAGRLSGFSGNLGDGAARTYSTGVTYSAFGSIRQEQFGTDTPVYNKRFFNVRGQMNEIRVSTYSITAPGQETNWNRGAILNVYSASPSDGWTASGADNNGNLRKQMIYVPNDDAISGWWDTTFFYEYDALNRLDVSREVRGGSNYWVQDFEYDRWGNRTINQTNTTGIAPKPQFSVSAATNQLGVPSGQLGAMTYDAAGNLTLDTYQGGSGSGTTGGTRTYDAENRMTQAQFVSGQLQTATYTYDADGRRVKRNMGASGEVWQVYGIAGELLAEYAPSASPSSPQKEYGYRAGELLVTAEPSALTNVSQGKPATQSSTGWGGDAARAVDGNTSGVWDSGSVSHTDYNAQAWWQVDLQSVQQISRVDFFLMTECCSSHGDFDVKVSDDGVNWSSYYVAGPLDNGSVAASRTGRYVRVQLRGTDYLALAEVQVWAGTGGAVNWMVTDQLGTPRMILDKTGSLSGVKRHDYYAFGEEVAGDAVGRTIARGYVGDSVRQKFTGYERDNETGLDFAQARYYSKAQGRFTSVDPENASANPDDPQSWNGYAYARNNPLLYTDPDGRLYVVRRADGSTEIITDEQFNQIKNNPNNAELGVVVKGGTIYNRNENGDLVSVGTYERVWFDDQDTQSNRMIWGLARMGPAMEKTILAFAAANLAPAVTIVGSGTLAGVGTQTLGLGGAGTGAAATEGSLTALSIQQLNGILRGTQQQLLKRLFGRGIEGAKQALTRGEIPPGLTREALMAYRELARRAIERGVDPGVQALRIEIIDQVLKKMK